VPQINIRIRFPSSAKRRLHPGTVFREEFVFSSEAGSRSEKKSDVVGFLFRKKTETGKMFSFPLKGLLDVMLGG
jgi:hypothetical protein